MSEYAPIYPNAPLLSMQGEALATVPTVPKFTKVVPFEFRNL